MLLKPLGFTLVPGFFLYQLLSAAVLVLPMSKRLPAKKKGRNLLPRVSFREVDELLSSDGPSLRPGNSHTSDPASSSGTLSTTATSGAFQGTVAHGHGRGDFPIVAPSKRGSREDALNACSSDHARRDALIELETDEVARSAVKSRASNWRTWQEFHAEWFGAGSDPLPLTPLKLQAVLAMLKRGRYRSVGQFVSRAKDAHVAANYAWTDALERTRKRGARSALRGIGPARQSAELSLSKVWELQLSPDDSLVPGGILNPRAFCVAGSFFLVREIEMCNA